MTQKCSKCGAEISRLDDKELKECPICGFRLDPTKKNASKKSLLELYKGESFP